MCSSGYIACAQTEIWGSNSFLSIILSLLVARIDTNAVHWQYRSVMIEYWVRGHCYLEWAYVASNRDLTYSPAVTTSYLAGQSAETQLGSAWVSRVSLDEERTR